MKTAVGRILLQSTADPPLNMSMGSNVRIIICTLICVLCLALFGRCACLRRSSPSPSLLNRGSVTNKGIKKEVLESLPKIPFDPESAGGDDLKLADCAICLSEFEEGELIRVLPQCGHGFHVPCIDTWFGAHASCPSCRQLLLVPASVTCHTCGAAASAAAAAVMDGASSSRFLP